VSSIVNGTSRVTVFPLLYRWPDNWLALAYATLRTDTFVGYIPLGGEHRDLMAIAGSHEPQRLYGSAGGVEYAQALWLLCAGWGGRGTPIPGTLDWPSAEWELNPRHSTVDVHGMYNAGTLTVGSFTLKDPGCMAEVELMMKECTARGLVGRAAV
jgi:hypothetical protein